METRRVGAVACSPCLFRYLVQSAHSFIEPPVSLNTHAFYCAPERTARSEGAPPRSHLCSTRRASDMSAAFYRPVQPPARTLAGVKVTSYRKRRLDEIDAGTGELKKVF